MRFCIARELARTEQIEPLAERVAAIEVSLRLSREETTNSLAAETRTPFPTSVSGIGLQARAELTGVSSIVAKGGSSPARRK